MRTVLLLVYHNPLGQGLLCRRGCNPLGAVYYTRLLPEAGHIGWEAVRLIPQLSSGGTP